MDALIIVVVYVVLVAAFLSGLLRLFGATFTFVDALMAAVLAGAISFIPTIGPHVAVIGILLVVYWRSTDVSIQTVLIASFVAHVAAGLIVYKVLFPQA